MELSKKMYQKFVYWIHERKKIFEKKEAGAPKPWTQDPILRDFRFTNVYREQDYVTRWIRKHWREPHEADRDLWFAMFVARYINDPNTLERLGYPVPWDPKHWKKVTAQIIADKGRIFNPAYIIPPTAGTASGGTTVSGPKHESIGRFFDMLWENRKRLRPTQNMDLEIYAGVLTTLPGVGRFMAGQVIADLKYTPILWKAQDWWTFAVSGPGSRRGMNWLYGREPTAAWKEDEWHEKLLSLQKAVRVDYLGPRIHAQDLQNCLCEFDKYCRALHGTGKPKQRYPGAK